MRVMIVGGGGREHTLAWKAAASPHTTDVLCVPGNAGTAAIGENVAVDANDVGALADLAVEQEVGLTIVGPEAPLCAGVVEVFAERGLRVFGPGKAAARIEGDKCYAKELMRRADVPTARFRCFDRFPNAKAYMASRDTPQVVKAAGLAAGKGVIVCDDPADGINVLEDMMVSRRFGEAGERVVVEDKLVGEELSVLALIDGRTIYVLEGSQDHKAVGEGGTGPNTGGMGAYSPVPWLTESDLREIETKILVPIVDALRNEGTPYRGVLYAGLMRTAGGFKVLEFNCRFGDPEAQVVLARLQSDFIDMINAVVDGRLDGLELHWDPRPAVCVVIACGGYPGAYEKGNIVEGLGQAGELTDVTVFHAGTKPAGERVLTAGGRVLGVTALGADLAAARARAYQAVDLIHFPDAYCRRDIAARVTTTP